MGITEHLALVTSAKSGDILLYHPCSFFGALIAFKNWHPIAHCEVYVGDGMSCAARDGIGVDIYPYRPAQLKYILRPKVAWDPEKAMGWFLTVQHQGYDWVGLSRFAFPRRVVPDNRNKMFCSEFALRFYRAGGFDPFPREDADAIAPFQFLSNPLFDLVYPQPVVV